MTINEIRKEFYRTNQLAQLHYISKETLCYYTYISGDRYWFYIPLIEIGDGHFHEEEPAKHLIRWIQLPEKQN